MNLGYRSRSGDQILSHDYPSSAFNTWIFGDNQFGIYMRFIPSIMLSFGLGLWRVIYNISWTCKTGHIYISKNKDQSLLSCSVLPEISLSDLFFLLKVLDKMFGDCKSQRFMTGEMLANFSKLIICQTLTSWSWTICSVFLIGFLLASWITKLQKKY